MTIFAVAFALHDSKKDADMGNECRQYELARHLGIDYAQGLTRGTTNGFLQQCMARPLGFRSLPGSFKAFFPDLHLTAAAWRGQKPKPLQVAFIIKPRLEALLFKEALQGFGRAAIVENSEIRPGMWRDFHIHFGRIDPVEGEERNWKFAVFVSRFPFTYPISIALFRFEVSLYVSCELFPINALVFRPTYQPSLCQRRWTPVSV